MSGVGIIIGAGIYVLVGEAAAEAGAAVWLSFLVAAALSVLTAFSYCELAAMFPRAGAEYEYARHAFPAAVAFLAGWVMIAGLTIASAAVALGWANYLRTWVAIDARLGAMVLLAAVTGVALAGVQHSARLTTLLSLVQVGGLVAVIAAGADHVGEVDLLAGASAAGVLSGAALIFFAFIGFDEVITLSEETKNPTRTVPAALMSALGLSALLYVAVAVVSVSVLGASTLAGSERPLADVMGHATGTVAGDIVTVVALVSTTNTTLLATTAASRLTFAMARDDLLPPRLARLSRRQVPALAVGAVVATSAVFVLFEDVGFVASVTDVAVYLEFLAVNATVVILRYRLPAAPRPFRIPFTLGRVPVIAVLGFLATLLMLSRVDALPLLLGGGVTLAGLAVALAVTRLHQAGRL